MSQSALDKERVGKMYEVPQFTEDCVETNHDLIRAHPLGLLVTAGGEGLMANPIPFLVNSSIGPLGQLCAHLAKPNPQWRELASVDEALVVFQGPQGYITPSWYATKRETGKVVPTWNYATVHVWGKPTVIEERDWLHRHVTRMTDLREANRADPWQVEDAPAQFIDTLLGGIVGFEIQITRLQGKWKMSQNRPERDRASVYEALVEQQAERHSDQEMAALVAERGRLLP